MFSAVCWASPRLDYVVRREHCLVTSLQLLGAVLAVEDDPSRAPAIVESLFSTTGPWPEFQDWRKYLSERKPVELTDESNEPAEPSK